MEKKNRTGCILVAVLGGALVLLCGCLLVAGLVTMPWWTDRQVKWHWGWEESGIANETERIEKTFEVGGEPSLEVVNFAGTVTIRAQEGNSIEVVATKRVQHTYDLGRISVEMEQQPGRLVIRTEKPNNLNNATVTLEIAAPIGTRLVMRSGAGTVEVRGIRGPLEVWNGAGTIIILDAAGPVNARTGAGTIEYQGRPEGECSFWSGAGTIVLRVPRDLDVQVDLSSSVGGVHSDFGVSGHVSMRSIRGTIGTGEDATITARSGVGTVMLNRQ